MSTSAVVVLPGGQLGSNQGDRPGMKNPGLKVFHRPSLTMVAAFGDWHRYCSVERHVEVSGGNPAARKEDSMRRIAGVFRQWSCC